MQLAYPYIFINNFVFSLEYFFKLIMDHRVEPFFFLLKVSVVLIPILFVLILFQIG